MPPKRLRRPAGAAVPRPKAGPKAKAGAKAKVRPARRDRGRGARPGGGVAAAFDLDKFNAGEEFPAHLVPGEVWKKGVKVVFTDALYWEEKVEASGEVLHLVVDGAKRHLVVDLLGTQAESLVKWKGANPTKHLEADLCLPDCLKTSKDGVVHVSKLRLWLARDEKDWMRNLEGMPGADDELGALRARGEGVDRKEDGDPRAKEKRVSSSSESSRKKKKKKKKSKKKKKDGEDDPEEGKKVQGTKDLKVVFGKTGLDPNALVRKRMMRRAKKVAKKKSRKDSSSTSGSTGSEGSDTQEDEGSSIFGEEARIKTVWSRIPGALTMQTLNQMQLSLVRQSGQPWELSQSQVPPIFSQYWRMFLYGKVTGPMNREIQSICYAQDLLLQGRIAQACDVLTQRVKSLEQTSAGGDWRISQRQELTPLDVASLSTNVETLDASKLHREEMKAKAAARPWERRGKGDYDSWDAKGKGKGKDKGKKGNKGPWGKNRDGEEKDGKEKGKS